mmetsp:Transcript_1400/g.4575  ORF Transcript_1400/g.4575 Transcript_1400/m.4575 type:complete len:249 (+) Transcript_1400:35-781(+)
MPTVPSSLSPRASSPLASSSRSPSRSPRCSPSSPSAKQREPWQARRDDANILQGLRLSGGPIEVARQVRAALAKPTALVRVIDLLRQMDDNNSGRIERAEWYKAMRELGFSGSRSEADAVFDSFDSNHDGAIQYQELWRVLRRDGASACGRMASSSGSYWEDSPQYLAVSQTPHTTRHVNFTESKVEQAPHRGPANCQSTEGSVADRISDQVWHCFVECAVMMVIGNAFIHQCGAGSDGVCPSATRCC